MLCEKCNNKNATVHYKQVINGDVTELNLCSDCAHAIETPISFDNFFKGFMDIGYGGLLNSPKKTKTIPIHKCPNCGYTLEDLQSSGKLGCASCYTSFRDRLNPLLKNIHGSNDHIGKNSDRVMEETLKEKSEIKSELLDLKKQIIEAIEQEEYEKAAELRDKIRALERGEANE